MEKGMRLCGGTFFTLLVKIKKNRKITNPMCLQALVDIFHVTTDSFEDSTYTSHTSSYKTCETDHTEWLVFDDVDAVKIFSNRICNPKEYLIALKDTENFIKDCLAVDEEKQSWLAHTLMELIDSDDTISDDAVFYIQKDGKSVIKSELLSKTKEIYFPSFLLGVWHYIIENVRDNAVGKNTLKKWNGKREKHTIGNVSQSNFDNRFSYVVVLPYKGDCEEIDAKEKEINSEMEMQNPPKKKLTPLEERILASGQAMADVLIPVLRNIEYGFEKRVLYSSSVLTDEEEIKYRSDESASMDVKEYYDPNNKKLIYRYIGSVNFTRRVDEFMNQNVVIAASFGDYSIESYTTYDNWKSKSYANNVLSEEDYECKIWFKIISTNDAQVSRVQILMIEEL